MSHLNYLYACMRYLMMLLSSVILVCGLILFGLGIWIKYGAASFIEVMGSFSTHLLVSSYICIGVGGALCLLGVIGWCGAWTENRWLIFVYFFIVSMMFIGQIVGTIVVVVYRDTVASMIRGASKDSLMTAYMGPASTDPISTAWNRIMIKYKCCGFENSIEDFSKSIFGTNTGLKYPKTCCVDMKAQECDGLDTTPSLLHPQSCMVKLIEVIKDKSVLISAIAAAVCVMELVSMIVSVVLFVRLGAADLF